MKYCQRNLGLQIYGYVFMTNHIHVIWKARDGNKLSDIVHSFKRYTTQEIKKLLNDESRKYISGLIKTSKYKRGEFQVWQQYNYPELVEKDKFFLEKLKYIHNNPVKKGYVAKPEDWLYSSARNYILEDNSVFEIDKLELF